MQTTQREGRTKIDISTRGCYSCGTEHAPGWQIHHTLPIQLKQHTIYITIPICLPCHRKKQHTPKNPQVG